MIDERVRAVLARLEEQDADERERGVETALRARQVAASTGRFLFALAAAQPGVSVLEIGGSRGYSGLWLGAAARLAGGRVVSLEADPAKVEAWRRNVADAGLDGVVRLVAGDAFETLRGLEGPFDLVFLDAEKEDYEALYALARPKLRRGSLVVADNILSHQDPLAQYAAARQAESGVVSVTVPLDRGLELTAVAR